MPVTVTVNAETAQALSALQDFFKKGSEGFAEVTKAGDFLKELGGQIAAAFSVGAFVEFTKHAIDAAEGLKTLSETTGISVKSLSGLKEAADKTRGGFSGMEIALNHFTQSLGTAIRQGGESAEAFRDLIGVEGLRGVATGATSMDEALQSAVQKLNAMPSSTQRAQLAMELFGRSWRDVLPAIAQVKGELEKGAITPEMAEDASQFNQSLRELKDELEKIFIALARELLPALREFVDFLKRCKEDLGLLSAAIDYTAYQIKLGVQAVEILTLAGVELAKGWIDAFQTAKRVLVDLVDAAVKGGRVIAEVATGNLIGGLKAYAAFNRSKGAAGEDVGAFVARRGEAMGNFVAQAQEIMQRIFGNVGVAQSASDLERHVPRDKNDRVDPSVAAKELMRDVNKAFQDAVFGRKALLDAEEKDMVEKAAKEILDAEQREDTITKIKATYSKKRLAIEQQQADAEREIQLAAVQAQRKLIEEDPFKTQAQKRQPLLDSLLKEKELLKQNIDIAERRAYEGSLTPEGQLDTDKQLQELYGKRAENSIQLATVGAQGTLSGEFKMMLREMQDEWGSTAKIMATTFKDVVGSAISSISSGITGLIEGTMTWSQALRQIGSSILSQVISGIVRLFAEWITGRQAASAVEIAATSAENVGKAISALFTSITSYGAAAAVGAAALVAALGVGIAAAAGAFAEGGRPPVGDAVLVGEKGRELMVFDRPGTILPNDVTENIMSGGSTGTGGIGKGNGQPILQLHFWGDDRAAMERHIRTHQGIQHAIVDTVAKNQHKLQS